MRPEPILVEEEGVLAGVKGWKRPGVLIPAEVAGEMLILRAGGAQKRSDASCAAAATQSPTAKGAASKDQLVGPMEETPQIWRETDTERNDNTTMGRGSAWITSEQQHLKRPHTRRAFARAAGLGSTAAPRRNQVVCVHTA